MNACMPIIIKCTTSIDQWRRNFQQRFVFRRVADIMMQVLQEVLSPLRSKAPKHMTLIKALGQQLSSFDDFELERLRHAFVKLSGGDSRVAQLTPERIR